MFPNWDDDVSHLLGLEINSSGVQHSSGALQFEVCRFINTQSVLKIPFQIAKTREKAQTVLKI